MFKKHTSMPASCFNAPPNNGDLCKCEQEFSEFKRQSDYTINELRSKLDVSVALIGEVNMEKFDLIDRIERMRLDVQTDNKLTPEISYNPVLMLKNVCTPKKKAIPTAKHRQLIKNDSSGSFLGDSNLPPSASSAVIIPTGIEMAHLTPIDCELRKRNLSFNSTGGDETRRSTGTDSGINTSEENEVVPVPTVAESGRKRTKRKRMKKFLASFICCGARPHSTVYKQM